MACFTHDSGHPAGVGGEGNLRLLVIFTQSYQGDINIPGPRSALIEAVAVELAARMPKS